MRKAIVRISGLQLDELMQIAVEGALHNHRTFVPGPRHLWRPWVYCGAYGALRHYLRDNGYPIRRPRPHYELDHHVTESIVKLEQRFGRSPRRAEIAHDMGIKEHRVETILQSRDFCISLDRYLDSDGPNESGDSAPQTPLAFVADPRIDVERTIVVRDLLRRLPRRDAQLLWLYYGACYPQSELGELFGVSQKQISRLLIRATNAARQSAGRTPVRTVLEYHSTNAGARAS